MQHTTLLNTTRLAVFGRLSYSRARQREGRMQRTWTTVILPALLLMFGTMSYAATGKAAHSSGSALPRIAFCQIPDPNTPTSAFEVKEQGDRNDEAHYWLTYSCRSPCRRWQACEADATDGNGKRMVTARGSRRLRLAFITDGMAGFLQFSSDGHATIAMHGGGGGTSYPFGNLVDALEKQTQVRTVEIAWADTFPWGWFTRTSPEPRTVLDQSRRPARVLAWIHDNLAAGHPFATVANSMGTVATLGPVLWHGLDRLIDYQIMIGGVPMWDVNASCGGAKLPHGYSPYVTGYCDGDATTLCQGDGQCSAAGEGRCQMPAPIGYRTVWENLFNHLSASTSCSDATGDLPVPALDLSSMRFTVRDWTVHHHIDFLINRNGPMPPELAQALPPVHGAFSPEEMRTLGQRMCILNLGPGGDEQWALGQFVYVYNALRPRSNVSWTTAPGAHSSWRFDVDRLVPLIKSRINTN
jgi:hypothetical protein